MFAHMCGCLWRQEEDVGSLAVKKKKAIKSYPVVNPVNYNNNELSKISPKAQSWAKIFGVTNSCLIELMSHSVGENSCLTLET